MTETPYYNIIGGVSREQQVKGETEMMKEYTINFSFYKHSGVGYMNAHNTEELADLMWPFKFEIVSVRLAKDED